MSSILSLAEGVHARALDVSSRYRRVEVELIDVIQEVEERRVFITQGRSSLFNYVVEDLGLSESRGYSLITVARKAREVPLLKEKIGLGAITLSSARKIASVLTSENQAEWLEKAETLSARQLEKEIVRVSPRAATPERVTYVTPERVSLEVGLSERDMLRLRRVQDLLSQSKRRPVTLEEALGVLTSEFLMRHDPVEKAKKHEVKKGPSVTVRKLFTLGRRPIPAAIRHRVNLRDQGRCTYVLSDGSRCNEARWIEIHHKIPVSEGGTNALENLTTLCSSHHRRTHL